MSFCFVSCQKDKATDNTTPTEATCKAPAKCPAASSTLKGGDKKKDTSTTPTSNDGGLADFFKSFGDDSGLPEEEANSGIEPNAPGDATVINAVSRFGETPFMTFQLYAPQENYLSQDSLQEHLDPRLVGDTYHCPGASFLVGLSAFYDKGKNDRVYQASCKYFEDGKGRMLRKKSCVNKEANTPGGKMDFTCPAGTLLDGLQTIYDANAKDRVFKFSCCQVETADSKPIGFIEQPVAEGSTVMGPICEFAQGSYIGTGIANAIQDSLDFQCLGGFPDQQGGLQKTPNILRRVTSNFIYGTGTGVKYDRIFSFECCVIGPVEKEQK